MEWVVVVVVVEKDWQELLWTAMHWCGCIKWIQWNQSALFIQCESIDWRLDASLNIPLFALWIHAQYQILYNTKDTLKVQRIFFFFFLYPIRRKKDWWIINVSCMWYAFLSHIQLFIHTSQPICVELFSQSVIKLETKNKFENPPKKKMSVRFYNFNFTPSSKEI